MTTSAITANPAAVLAAQNEAGAASRAREEKQKPPVEPPKETHRSSRYAERREARAEGRGSRLDREA